MGNRPFKLVNRTESQRVCERVSETASRWAQDWLSASLPKAEVAVQPAAESLSACIWTARRIGTEMAVAIGIKKGDTSLRLRFIGTADQSSVDLDDPLLEELEGKMIEALLESLLQSGEHANTDIPSSKEIEAPGSGYVVLQCRWSGALEIQLLLWPKTIESWLGQTNVKAGKPISVSHLDALDTQTVKLEVVAGEAEIAFEELRSLCEGVVIKLDRRIDQPMQLRLVGDGIVCSGHLGLNDDRRAVQLVATT